ncbi:AI-2E family transporter [Calidifontibacter indicus]|uniref:AI-2E family transporter n=1 Tax=Calidifontibacter indicus TaxID=419650 RepID=UPI003D717B10
MRDSHRPEQQPTAVKVVETQRPKRPLDDVSFGVQVAAWWSLCFVLITGGVVTLAWLLDRISLVTITVAVAIMICALLQPLVALLVRFKVPRTLAVLIVFLGGIAVISWLIWFVISQIAYSKDSLLSQLDGGLASIRDWLVNGPLKMTPKQADRYSVQLGQTLQEQFGGSSAALDRATGAIGVLSGGVFCLFATLFMLFDNGRIWGWVVSMFPDHIHDHVQEAGQAGWRTLTAYMRSLVLLAAINAVAMVPVMMIADMPLVVPLAVLLFLGSLVPLIGVLVAGVVVCLIAFVSQGLTTAIVVAIALVLIVQLFGNLLNPIILGKAVDIHPLAILVGVTGGTLVAGIFGAFVAVPFVAVVNNAIRAVREHHGSRSSGGSDDLFDDPTEGSVTA